MVLTPIEKFQIKGREVHVKMDHLVGDGTTLPRWSKIEGIRKILESDYIDKSKPLTHLSVYGSWTGWVLSVLCKEYGIEFISSYPNSKTYPPEILEIIKSNGAKLNPLKPNMMSIMENKLRSISSKEGYQQLPYAFNHPTYVSYMQGRMREVLQEQDYDHLVVSMGSGVTASGLIREFLEYKDWKDILNNKRKVHTVTMSSIESTKKILNENKAGDLNNINIYKSEYAFDDFMDDVFDWDSVWDLNEFWERKMFWWLYNNIEQLDGKILFWNIGGSYRKSLNLK